MAASVIATAVPPALMKGSGTPVAGSVTVTVAMLISAWKPIQVVSPVASASPKRSGARIAARYPRTVRARKPASVRVVPTNPVSSPMMAKM